MFAGRLVVWPVFFKLAKGIQLLLITSVVATSFFQISVGQFAVTIKFTFPSQNCRHVWKSHSTRSAAFTICCQRHRAWACGFRVFPPFPIGIYNFENVSARPGHFPATTPTNQREMPITIYIYIYIYMYTCYHTYLYGRILTYLNLGEKKNKAITFVFVSSKNNVGIERVEEHQQPAPHHWKADCNQNKFSDANCHWSLLMSTFMLTNFVFHKADDISKDRFECNISLVLVNVDIGFGTCRWFCPRQIV